MSIPKAPPLDGSAGRSFPRNGLKLPGAILPDDGLGWGDVRRKARPMTTLTLTLTLPSPIKGEGFNLQVTR